MHTSDLAKRVAVLERSNRRWRKGALALLVLAAGCVAMGQATKEEVAGVVQARGFSVVGPGGRARLLLTVDEEGTAGVVVSGRDGTPRAMLGVTPDDSPVVRLSDDTGRLRAAVAVDPDGEPRIELFDEGETTRLRLTTIDGQPGLALIDAEGKERVEFAALDDGAAGVALNGADGALQGAFGTAALIGMLTGAEGLPSAAYLAICDREGKVVRQVP